MSNPDHIQPEFMAFSSHFLMAIGTCHVLKDMLPKYAPIYDSLLLMLKDLHKLDWSDVPAHEPMTDEEWDRAMARIPTLASQEAKERLAKTEGVTFGPGPLSDNLVKEWGVKLIPGTRFTYVKDTP